MPRKRILTWQAGSGDRPGRWRKIYKGRTVYCGTGTSKSDLEGYQRAVAVWQEEKKRIDTEVASQPKPNQPDYDEAIRDWDKVLQWSQNHGDLANAALAREKLDNLQTRLKDEVPPPLAYGDRFWDGFTIPQEIIQSICDLIPLPKSSESKNNLPESEKAARRETLLGFGGVPLELKQKIWQDRLEIQDRSPGQSENTIEAHLTRYLEKERVRVDAKRLSASRFTSKRNNLFRFRDWIGSNTPVEAITGELLLQFHEELLRQIAANTLAQDTAHGRLSDTKGFVQWLWRMNALEELPRLLAPGSNELTIGKKVAAPEVFTTSEIQKLLMEASDRPRLFILLMLNCGMYQTDISDIQQNEVDWKAGTISRKRSKTKHHATVPTVTYQLWPETFRLLKKFRSQDEHRALLNTNGNPLVLRDLKPDGSPLTNDSIKNAIDRVKRKTSIGKPMKLFRKTSASLIRGNSQFRGLEDLFLGLSPTSISDRHYAKPPEELLAKATQWLATHYGLKGK